MDTATLNVTIEQVLKEIKEPTLKLWIEETLEDAPDKHRTAVAQAFLRVAHSGFMGDLDQLKRRYRKAFRQIVEPDRKSMQGHIDRSLIKNAVLAAAIDLELQDVTEKELERATAAVRKLVEQTKALRIAKDLRTAGTKARTLDHDPSDLCRIVGEHSDLKCGYMKTEDAWQDTYRAAVRAALA